MELSLGAYHFFSSSLRLGWAGCLLFPSPSFFFGIGELIGGGCTLTRKFGRYRFLGECGGWVLFVLVFGTSSLKDELFLYNRRIGGRDVF